jgi:hypothetical protein
MYLADILFFFPPLCFEIYFIVGLINDAFGIFDYGQCCLL